jgi:hypothetical protein
MLLELEHTLKNKPSIVVKWRKRWAKYVAKSGGGEEYISVSGGKARGKVPVRNTKT